MLRRFLSFSVGALVLVAALGNPAQLHAQHMRGGRMPAFRGSMMTPGFRGSMTPGFRGRFEPRFARERFSTGFNRGIFGSRFDRDFNRFEGRRIDRDLFINPRFLERTINPRLNTIFFPGFVFPF